MTSDNLLGTYCGTCTNQSITPEETAKMTVILKRIEGNEVFGDLTIHGDLEGGSEFSGVLNDGRLSFVTRDKNGKLTITWTTSIAQGLIDGSYRVLDERFMQKLFGLKNQEGIWSCKK